MKDMSKGNTEWLRKQLQMSVTNNATLNTMCYFLFIIGGVGLSP
jgi:hypothetical protein